MHAKLKESVPDPKPADWTDEIWKALTQLHEKTTPKSKPTIAAAHRYHALTDKAIGEHRLMTQEEVGRIVSQVIRQELRGQINRHGNYQNTRGRLSYQKAHGWKEKKGNRYETVNNFSQWEQPDPRKVISDKNTNDPQIENSQFVYLYSHPRGRN